MLVILKHLGVQSIAWVLVQFDHINSTRPEANFLNTSYFNGVIKIISMKHN